MGLDVTATHVIWFFALVAVAGGALAAFFDVQRSLDASQAAQDVGQAERLRTFLANATYCYDAVSHVLSVNATNAGSVQLDASKLTILVDGAPRSGWSVTGPDASSGAVWGPGEWANFTATGVASAPVSVALATEHGATARAAPAGC